MDKMYVKQYSVAFKQSVVRQMGQEHITELREAQAFVDSEDLRAAMQDAGVSGPPEIWIPRLRSG